MVIFQHFSILLQLYRSIPPRPRRLAHGPTFEYESEWFLTSHRLDQGGAGRAIHDLLASTCCACPRSALRAPFHLKRVAIVIWATISPQTSRDPTLSPRPPTALMACERRPFSTFEPGQHRLPARAAALLPRIVRCSKSSEARLAASICCRNGLNLHQHALLRAEQPRAVMSRPVLGSSCSYAPRLGGCAERPCTLANCAPRPGVLGSAGGRSGRRIVHVPLNVSHATTSRR